MPELPEIECLTRDLKTLLENCSIGRISCYRSDLRWPIPISEMTEKVSHNEIVTIFRRSKYIVIGVPKGFLIFHLGMSGNIYFSILEDFSIPHTHVTIEILNHRDTVGYLHFIDPRRFGSISFCSNQCISDFRLFKFLGPDPLTHPDLADVLAQKSRKKKSTIKSFIMDSKNIVGVGNIYASEVLFRAKIHPFRPASELSKKNWDDLSKTIREVLLEAIAAGGTSFKDYRALGGGLGNFREKLLVYGREKKPCQVCGSEIVATRHQSRSTYFCPLCQRD